MGVGSERLIENLKKYHHWQDNQRQRMDQQIMEHMTMAPHQTEYMGVEMALSECVGDQET